MTEQIEQSLFDGFAARDAEGLQRGVLKILKARRYECILHPLGFHFLRLVERGETTIRLHYWPAGDRLTGTAKTPYHDHVWELCSCVLAGSLENVLLQVEPNEHGNFQIADINQADNVDQVVIDPSRIQMTIQSRERYVAGDFYEIRPRVFHYTDVGEDAVLTVVQSRVVVKGGPRTLMPLGSQGHGPSREFIGNSDQILQDIDRLLQTIVL